MPKHIKMTLDKASIARAIREVNQYKVALYGKAQELARRLAAEGLEVARVGFMTAHYDGRNDVVTEIRQESDNRYVIEASGQSVLFIEFGTGVMNPEHPQADELGMKHGQYGLGLGNKAQWGYYGVGGTDGKFIRETDEGSFYLTRGNPPAMAMWDASKHIKDRVLEIAREVFASD